MGGLVDELDSVIDRYNDSSHRERAIHHIYTLASMPGYRAVFAAEKRAMDLALQMKKDLEKLHAAGDRLADERRRLESLQRNFLQRIEAQRQEIATLRQALEKKQQEKIEAESVIERTRDWARRALARIRSQKAYIHQLEAGLTQRDEQIRRLQAQLDRVQVQPPAGAARRGSWWRPWAH